MPRLSQIFHGHNYKDLKPGQCTHIKPIEEKPFIRRCPSPVAEGLKTCKRHSYSVTWKLAAPNGKTELRTKYFDQKWKAEDFRKNQVPLSWVDINYGIQE